MQLLTAHQAKVLATELSLKRNAADEGKYAQTLLDAQVQVLPHQVDAALFAFASPLSQGALLADEVGLGKTIEAALVMAQFWASHKRRLLVICPANLRKQWQEEFEDKFNLPSVILEAKTLAREAHNRDNFFEQDRIVIVSYQFARDRNYLLRITDWHLVVLDEAHKLRNLTNATAQILKAALNGRRKLLLTATPLQNNLVELYGLTSIIDEGLFGDLDSFKEQYLRGSQEEGPRLSHLKERIARICHRTLRKQVQEYVSYPKRTCETIRFSPSDAEHELYEQLNAYLQRPDLFALPASQRALITMVFRKLLASSRKAIVATLQALVHKLEAALRDMADPAAATELVEQVLQADFEHLAEVEDTFADGPQPNPCAAPTQRAQLEAELAELRDFLHRAQHLNKDSKGECLLHAINTGMARTQELGGNSKALIFTESCQTQKFIDEILTNKGYKTVFFNGTNADKKSKEILTRWLASDKAVGRRTSSRSANMRAALVDYFRSEADVMIATEAGAEGINLQFCSLIINYDLPWNPQRIEQRIGRCHRFGQKNEVVVVNFLNERNEADKRVYDLLEHKFNLFEGVFGASDEILGAVSDGINVEKRIADIYQQCRSSEEIAEAFNQLEAELRNGLANIQQMQVTRNNLLSNFDQEVQRRLRMRHEQGAVALSALHAKLWALTRHYLQPYAQFEEDTYRFTLERNPYKAQGLNVETGPYTFPNRHAGAGDEAAGAVFYRPSHPLAQQLIGAAMQAATPPGLLRLYPGRARSPIGVFEGVAATRGYLTVARLACRSFEDEEHLLAATCMEDGQTLGTEATLRLLEAPAEFAPLTLPAEPQAQLARLLEAEQAALGEVIGRRNQQLYQEEIQKIEARAADLELSLALPRREKQRRLKELKAAISKSLDLREQLTLEEEKLTLEREIRILRNRLEDEENEIHDRKHELIRQTRARMALETTVQPLLTVAIAIA